MENKFIKFKVVISMLCVGLCAGGCVVTKVHTMPVKTFSAPYDNVWDAVISYLEKDSEPVVSADKEKGFISTDWVNMQKVFSVKRYRYDIQIIKVNDTETRVGIASPQQAYSMGDWEDMLPHERRAQRMFKKIFKDINPLSKRKTYRPFNKRQKGVGRSEV